MSGITALNVKIPTELRERARVIAKRIRSTTTALIVEALSEKVDAYDAKRRAELELVRRDQEETRSSRRRTISLVDPAALAPLPSTLEPMEEDPSVDEDADALDDGVYRGEAEKIFNALADPIERRIAAQTAVKVIREQRPLTAPDSDHVILRRLDKLIVRLQAKRPPPPEVGPASAAIAEPAAAPAATLLGQFFSGLTRKPSP